MRRSLLHKMLLLGLFLVTLSGKAGATHARHTTIGIANTKTHHLSNEHDHAREIEIAITHEVTGAGHRSYVKTGAGSSALANDNSFSYFIAKTSTLCSPIEESRSGHLLLIFPFHYFW